jgi:DNA polymerase-3 subunit beta
MQAEDGYIRLIATDIELCISCRIPASVAEGGSLTAPARTLTEVLANLPDRADVAISVDKSHTVHVDAERSHYKILGLPAEDYPRLPEVKDSVSFSLPQARLKEMIRQTIFAVSPDEARAILTGILMSFDGETLTFAATDTHRLAVKKTHIENGHGSKDAIVPARAMNELFRLLSDAEGEVEVVISENQVQFNLPGPEERQIVSRLIEGQFPNYQRVIPQQYDKRLTIPVNLLHRAVRRASIVARENAHRVVLRTEGENLVLTAESRTVGNAHEEIEVLRQGDDVQIAFNAKYLLDVLGVLGEGDGIYLELTGPVKPGVVRPVIHPDENAEESVPAEDYLCVLMPMQIV